jgi:autotransporter-associated beta strand protein
MMNAKFSLHDVPGTRTKKSLSAELTAIIRQHRIPVCLLGLAIPAMAETFQPSTGSTTWNATTSWNPANIPNAEGAAVVFNGAATAENPAQTGNRTATLDGPKTVGSILFNTDLSNFTNSITTGTGGPLTFDAAGAGPATITTTGAGTGNNTISVAISLADNLVATVNNTTATSGAGSLNLTAAISGPGGFTKTGDGLATFGTGAKTYTGPTILSGGRIRISLAASPAATSSFTINSGAQLTLISASTYTFGSGPLNLNGSGATSGPFAAFPGAIRQDTGIVSTITNAVVLQSDTVLHVQASAGTGGNPSPTGSMTLSGSISGSGQLTFTAPGSNPDQGTLVLTNTNTYSGGTLVAGGIVQLNGPGANLGLGDVTVSNATSPLSIARLSLQTGVLDGIADTATLTLAGGGTLGIADQGFADLGFGINEVVGALILGSSMQGPGTYGSTLSAATFKSDEYFSGSGVLTVIPEPAAFASLLGGIAVLGLFRRRAR